MSTDEQVSHTPGPWLLRRDNRRERYDIGVKGPLALRLVAEVSFGFSEPAESQQHANARLIAAVPDLLALAKRYASECAECDGSGETELCCEKGIGPECCGEAVRGPCPDCEDILAVIAKAEGRS